VTSSRDTLFTIFHKMAAKFSIDDAFESDDEDPIRIYGSTTDHVPFKGMTKYTKLSNGENKDDDLRKSHNQADLTLDEVRIEHCGSRSDSPGLVSPNSEPTSVLVTATKTPKHWWQHHVIQEHCRMIVCSLSMLLAGLGLLVIGVVIEVSHSTLITSTIFFIAGIICIIPGAYYVVYITCAMRGKKGFSFKNLPDFR